MRVELGLVAKRSESHFPETAGIHFGADWIREYISMSVAECSKGDLLRDPKACTRCSKDYDLRG